VSETIFVIIGESGEYSDRTEWCVLAVRDEEKAKSLVLEYDRIGRELELERSELYKVYQSHRLDWLDRSAAANAVRDAYTDGSTALSKRHPDPQYYGESRYQYSQIELV
jgi:hypothetical protein